MSLSGGLGRRARSTQCSSRGRAISGALLAVGSLLMAHPFPAVIRAQPGKNWVGERVMQRASDLTLHVGNRRFSPSENIPFYRVRRAAGPFVLLKSESGPAEGWASLDDVVAVDEAVDFFTDRFKNDPRDPFLYAAHARLRQDEGEVDLALGDYSKAIELNHNRAWFYNQRGWLFNLKKQYDKARADFDEVIARWPDNADAYSKRGTTWLNEMQYDKAISDYNRAINLNQSYPELYLNRGLAWAEKQQYARAIDDFDRATRLSPKFAVAYVARGRAWSCRKDYDRAIKEFTHAIELDPRLDVAYQSRGDARIEKGDLDNAIDDMNAAIRVNPTSALLYASRGRTWNAKKDYVKAIEDFNEALRIDPEYALAYNLRGCVWHINKEYDRAVSDYTAAIRIDSNFAAPYRNRGDILRERKKLDSAISDYSTAIRLDPSLTDAYTGRALAWKELKAYDKAIADLGVLVKRQPDNAAVHNQMAWIWATSLAAEHRDGKKAVESALRLRANPMENCKLPRYARSRVRRSRPVRGGREDADQGDRIAQRRERESGLPHTAHALRGKAAVSRRWSVVVRDRDAMWDELRGTNEGERPSARVRTIRTSVGRIEPLDQARLRPRGSSQSFDAGHLRVTDHF